MARIVVLSRRSILHPRAGGASRYVHEIFRRLTKKHDVTVISEGLTSGKPVEEIDGLTYVNARGGLMRVRLPLTYIRGFARKADILIDNADVAIPWFSPLFSKKPVITIIHQLVREVFYEELTPILATFGYVSEPALYRLYSRSTVVAMSKSTADDLLRFGIPGKNIRIIGPGCPYPSNERIPLAMRSQKLIGCVSRLMHYKGLQFAIDAIDQIRKELPDIRLEIAGSGPYRAELEGLVKRIDVGANVAFLGRVSEQRKLKLYRESRAIVLSSIREGYGLSVIEANSVGTPAVGWNVPGLRDSIIDNKTGLLASFPNNDHLAKQIYNIMTDDSAWNNMSANAWKWANRHSWDQSAQDFGDTIEFVLANASPYRR